ncbi:hypothetical protein [Bacillus cihuensis]|uniref:hypothetical protein n=1 Tax=Bacillus cihuensis TaxID=1208599 RepID=UPI00048F8484|nr:hypothetical protein [Bacillus cihuensis]
MKDIIFLVIVGLCIYVISRIILKEPILPWKDKKTQRHQYQPVNNKGAKKNKKNDSPLDEEEAVPFKEFFPHILKIENHMIHHSDYTFSMMAEVDPVNYYLLDQSEQEAVDAIYETWLAQINYPVRQYLQNRFIDLAEPIEAIQKVMEEEDDLPPLAYEYGQKMIEDLINWQRSQPRFELKRFLIFDYKIDQKDIKANDQDELEEKILEKAFNELYRRVSTARSQLRKADMRVDLLTTDGISEVLYYTFNRRKAVKNQYKDIENKEQLALYVTADQSASQITLVKGEMSNAKEEEETAGINRVD